MLCACLRVLQIFGCFEDLSLHRGSLDRFGLFVHVLERRKMWHTHGIKESCLHEARGQFTCRMTAIPATREAAWAEEAEWATHTSAAD